MLELADCKSLASKQGSGFCLSTVKSEYRGFTEAVLLTPRRAINERRGPAGTATPPKAHPRHF